MKITAKIFMLFIFILQAYSCSEEFLEAKPDKSLNVPKNEKDLLALLDNSNNFFNSTPVFGLLGSDDIYLTEEGLLTLLPPYDRAYKWDKEFYPANITTNANWNRCYSQVFGANVVLDAVKDWKLERFSAEQSNVAGMAYFHRAFAFYHLAQLFAEPYQESISNKQLGIPLRISSDVTSASKRASLAETYEQILSDLQHSVQMLPKSQVKLTRPTQIAAKALMARVYLIMANYAEAERYSTEVLEHSDAIIDYNKLSASSTRPFPVVILNGDNPEVIFYSVMTANSALQSASITSVDSTLIKTYEANDLRAALFFRKQNNGNYSFKGQYTGSSSIFTGLALDEVLLTRAECRARRGAAQEALDDLNKLLVKRWRTDTYVPITLDSVDDILPLILQERRKELVYRDLRWIDLRRLNLEDRFKKVIYRQIGTKRIELLPNDIRYTLPIAFDVISRSNMEQNPR